MITSVEKEVLKSALSKIWALVYRATQTDLTFDQINDLQRALNIVSANWSENDRLKGRANWLCDLVHMSGVLPNRTARKLQGTEEIMDICQSLQRYLDSN